MLNGALKIFDKVLELIDKVGVEWAVAIGSVGLVLYYLGHRALPAVWNEVKPYVGRYFEAHVTLIESRAGLRPSTSNELQRAFPASISPTANHSAELVRAAGEVS